MKRMRTFFYQKWCIQIDFINICYRYYGPKRTRKHFWLVIKAGQGHKM